MVSYVPNESEDFILSFDMCDEVFRKLPVPILSSKIVQSTSRLMVFNDSLSFILHNTETRSLESWVLDEFDANRIWTKILTIRPCDSFQRP